MVGSEKQGEVCQKETRELRTVGQPIVSEPCRRLADLSGPLSEGGRLMGFEQKSDVSQEYITWKGENLIFSRQRIHS